MTVIAKVKESYEKDKENFIIVKTETGYNVTNMRSFKMYTVTNIDGKVECNCPDYIHRRKELNQCCKHLYAVRKNQDRKNSEIQKIIAKL